MMFTWDKVIGGGNFATLDYGATREWFSTCEAALRWWRDNTHDVIGTYQLTSWKDEREGEILLELRVEAECSKVQNE